MNLGELIAELEQHPADKTVREGFSHPHSYRGFYDQLAFQPARNVTVGQMLTDAPSADGATYVGWKGGEYGMDRDTTVWIAIEGTSSMRDEPLNWCQLDAMLNSAADNPESLPQAVTHDQLANLYDVIAPWVPVVDDREPLVARIVEALELSAPDPLPIPEVGEKITPEQARRLPPRALIVNDDGSAYRMTHDRTGWDSLNDEQPFTHDVVFRNPGDVFTLAWLPKADS